MLHAQQIAFPREATIDPADRHLLHTTPLVTAGRSSDQHGFVNIGAKQRKSDTSMSVSERQILDNP
jgi:hypothetical protein